MKTSIFLCNLKFQESNETTRVNWTFRLAVLWAFERNSARGSAVRKGSDTEIFWHGKLAQACTSEVS